MSDAATGTRHGQQAGTDAGGWTAWLAPGERLLWQGAPGDGIRFRREDRMLIPFSLVFGAFALVWWGAAYGIDAPWPMLAFGTVFVLIGLYLVIGRFLWDAYVRARTRYALTDRRALIATRHPGRRMKDWPITADMPLDVETGPTTSIYFARERVGGWRRRHARRVGFEFIADGPEVLSLIRAVQRGDAGRVR
jgi:hypothetical protein